MRKKLLFIFCALLSMVFVGCNDPEPEVETPMLDVLSNSIAFVEDGGEKNVQITSNTKWSVQIENADWLSVSPMSGEGSDEITISATQNTDTVARTANVIVSVSSSLNETIVVKQNGITPEVVEPDGGNFSIGYIELLYEGEKYNSTTVAWSMYLYDTDYVASGGASGKYIGLNLIGDSATQTFRDGYLTGDFTVTTSSSSSAYTAGDIVESAYGLAEDAYSVFYLTNGTLSITQVEGNNYRLDANFGAEDATTLDFIYTVDMADDNKVTFDDQSYFSDIDGDYVQNISEIFVDYNGDALGMGNAVWKLHIWGDGMEVNETGNPISGDGTYLVVQFYTPIDNTTGVGTYTVGLEQAIVTNTVEPGQIASDYYAGTWLYQFGEGYITGMTPAVSGELEISKDDEDNYTISYNFGDDNPYGETKFFSGNYTGPIHFNNRVDTGDFDEEASSFTYVGDKICDNHSWELSLVSNEYVESEGQEGMIVEFVLNTSYDDTFYVDITDKIWEFMGAESTDDYSIYSGVITTYKDGVPSASEVNGGNIVITQTTNSNLMYLVELNSISTVDGDTYDMYTISDMERTDNSHAPFGDINISEENIVAANLEYYGSVGAYTNWDIALYNDEYNGVGEGNINNQLAVILNMYVDGELTYEQGLPDGEYSYVASGTAAGIWDDYTLIKKGFDIVGLQSGSVKVESLGDDNYRFTFDFFLNQDDAKLIGVYEGAVELRNQTGYELAPRR